MDGSRWACCVWSFGDHFDGYGFPEIHLTLLLKGGDKMDSVITPFILALAEGWEYIVLTLFGVGIYNYLKK